MFRSALFSAAGSIPRWSALQLKTALTGRLRTFNVRFSEKEYDETWAAVAVAKHIGSRHETLEMEDVQGTWDHVTGLLLHAGQPFADTSLFAVNAVCQADAAARDCRAVRGWW